MEMATRILENLKNYDGHQCSYQILLWLRELEHFYNTIVPQQGNDPSKAYYNIKPKSSRPNEGQVAYFNLRRGYPKELYDGHWCYVLKDFNTKFLIVPLTSVKNDEPKDKYEIEINIKDFINDLSSRIQVTDLRFIDAQRINENQKVFDVLTDRTNIINEIFSILSLQEHLDVLNLKKEEIVN